MKNSDCKILLHACCGPCSLEPVRLAQEAGVNPTIYYTNSNIHPAAEYARRLDTLREWASKGGVDGEVSGRSAGEGAGESAGEAEDENSRRKTGEAKVEGARGIFDPELKEPVTVIEGTYDPQLWENVCGVVGDAAVEKAAEWARATFAKDTQTQATQGILSENSQNAAPAAGTSTENALAEGTSAADTSAEDAPAKGDPAEATSPQERAFREAMAGGAPFEAAVTLAIDPAARQARCRACYRFRFEEVAQYAAAHGFDAIGTTLTISPYQYTQVIREELERAAAAHNLKCAFVDYSPYYAQATQRSRDIGMYRQNFCGCRISDLEAQAERAQRKYQRKQKKLARKLQSAPPTSTPASGVLPTSS